MSKIRFRIATYGLGIWNSPFSPTFSGIIEGSGKYTGTMIDR